MNKKLSEMSLKELWELFPICLTEHKDYWSEQYEEEKELLSNILSVNFKYRISHIGSTAINQIQAKPIVDILIECPDIMSIKIVKDKLINSGYICMSENDERVAFNKGYTEKGFSEKVFHIHLHLLGDNDELYFRDYLNENISVAYEYEALKQRLSKEYKYDRDEYTHQKAEFVNEYTRRAKENFKGRY